MAWQQYTTATSKFKTLTTKQTVMIRQDWIGLSSVLRPLQHSIGYMGDGFYRSKDHPTNSIKVLKGTYTPWAIKNVSLYLGS